MDTAATNGAVRWVKFTGSSNTGWRVTAGDTGWRNVNADILNGWVIGALRLRRINDVIYLHVNGPNGAAATADALYTLPAGFRVTTSGYTISPRELLTNAANGIDTSRVILADISTSNVRVLGAAYTGVNGGTALLQIPLVDNWPSALPGLAA